MSLYGLHLVFFNYNIIVPVWFLSPSSNYSGYGRHFKHGIIVLSCLWASFFNISVTETQSHLLIHYVLMWSNLLWPIGLSHLTHLKSRKNAQFKHIICHLISQPSLLQPSLKNTANIIDRVANINWAFNSCLTMLNIVCALSIFIFITTRCDKSLLWLNREDMNLSKLQKIMEDRGAWHAAVLRL